jgi:hypothetical protein
MMKRSFASKAVAVGVLSFAALSSAYATPLIGTVNTVGSASVTLTDITFQNIFAVANLFNVSPPITGSFSTLAAGASGSIANLNSTLQPTGGPLETAIVDTGWMVFPAVGAFPGARFDLENISVGSFTAAACGASPLPGQTCTPFPSSPFNLTNLGSGTTVTGVLIGFSVQGDAVNLTTLEETDMTGAFSTQINGTNLQAILATIGAGGIVTNSYSANFTTTPQPTVPEPSTVSLLGAGLIGLGLLQRRRAKK